MKTLTIANIKTVNEKARAAVPELAEKVQAEYNKVVEKALTTKENSDPQGRQDNTLKEFNN
jgi:hypothetical protein